MESAGLQRFPVASLIRRNLSVVAAVIALWVAGSLLAIAQDEVATRVRAATEGSTKPYVYPAIDPALAINGAALLSELRKGGYVLFMRHTETGTVTPECTQPNLTARGERDARFVGESLRTMGIRIGRVVTSPVCRVLQTAKLLEMGEPEISADLSNIPTPADADLGAIRQRRLAEVPGRATNTMLVSHLQSGKSPSHWIHLDFGEIVVYKSDGKGGATAVARIRADDWYDLKALNGK